jgi:hypothetical protein
VLGSSQDVFLAVAGRSPEFRAVNQALHAGSRAEDLECSPPVLVWSEEVTGAGAPPKSWWQFWN